MKQRPLGRTGVSCSEIALGTWAFGSPVYGAVTAAESLALIRRALDQGITLFDTAPLYGSAEVDGIAESLLGEALGADRDRVLISTKFGRTSTRPAPAFDGASVEQSVNASLRRLRCSHIDLLFFHSPFSPAEIDESVWPALDRLRQAGKVRLIGHSVSEYHATAGMCRRWIAERKIDVVQVVLSLFHRQARELIATCREAGIGVLARECLANGFLRDGLSPQTIFPAGTVNSRYGAAEIAERVNYANELATHFHGAGTPRLSEAAFAWVLDQPGVSAALSGARNPAELADAVRGAAQGKLPAALAHTLERIHPRDFAAV